MASENLARLQATANRYANSANFSPLVIDGGMGPKTITAIVSALAVASGAATQDQVNTSSGIQGAADAAQYANGLRSGDQAVFIMQNVVGMNATLNAVGDALGLVGAASGALTKPTTVQTTVPDKSAFKVKAAANAGAFDSARLWLRQRSTVEQAGIGIGALLVLAFGFSKLKRKPERG